MPTPYDVIFQSIGVAEQNLSELKNVDINDYKFQDIFIALILNERLIDKQRVIVPPGSGGEYPEQKKEVEMRLGVLRVGIHEAANKLGKDATRAIFAELGDSIKAPYGFGIQDKNQVS